MFQAYLSGQDPDELWCGAYWMQPITPQTPTQALMNTMGTFLFLLIKFVLSQFGTCMQWILTSHIPFLASHNPCPVRILPTNLSLISMSICFVLWSLRWTKAISMTVGLELSGRAWGTRQEVHHFCCYCSYVQKPYSWEWKVGMYSYNGHYFLLCFHGELSILSRYFTCDGQWLPGLSHLTSYICTSSSPVFL